MKRARTFANAIACALLYTAITIAMIPFAAAIWALACVAHGLEWMRERVA